MARLLFSTRILLLLALGSPAGTLAGDGPSLAPYLGHLPSFHCRLLSFSSDKGKARSPFSQKILEEYILVSHSRWKVAAGGRAAWEMEVFEMQDPPGAFGLFTLWSDLEGGHWRWLELAVDALSAPGRLAFWRGNYFLVLRAPSRELTPVWARKLVSEIAAAVPQLNLHPVSTLYLPRQGLIKDSIRFYLGKAGFALDPDFPDPFRQEIGLGEAVEITTARYRPSGSRLVLLGYPTSNLARDHFVRLQRALGSYLSRQGIYLKRAGVLVSVFFGPAEEAEHVLSAVEYSPSVHWIYTQEPDPILSRSGRGRVTILGLVRTSMLLTLCFILVTLVAGLAAGLFRYRRRLRHPELQVEAAHLGLDLGGFSTPHPPEAK